MFETVGGVIPIWVRTLALFIIVVNMLCVHGDHGYVLALDWVTSLALAPILVLHGDGVRR